MYHNDDYARPQNRDSVGRGIQWTRWIDQTNAGVAGPERRYSAPRIFWSTLDCQLFCVLNTWPPYLIIRSHHDHRQQQQARRIRRATILLIFLILAERIGEKDCMRFEDE